MSRILSRSSRIWTRQSSHSYILDPRAKRGGQEIQKGPCHAHTQYIRLEKKTSPQKAGNRLSLARLLSKKAAAPHSPSRSYPWPRRPRRRASRPRPSGPSRTTRRVRERRLAKFRQNVARFRLYRLRFLQENMRFAAFFKIYQIIKLKFLKSFGGLVLGCIETDFCRIICVLQHFLKSTI